MCLDVVLHFVNIIYKKTSAGVDYCMSKKVYLRWVIFHDLVHNMELAHSTLMR